MISNSFDENRLKDIDGEWHEFESKALRRENEKKEKEARRAAQEAASSATIAAAREKQQKRPNDAKDTPQREAKRAHIEVADGGDSRQSEAQSSSSRPNAEQSQSHGHGQESRRARNG